jgi:hypothetical protein
MLFLFSFYVFLFLQAKTRRSVKNKSTENRNTPLPWITRRKSIDNFVRKKWKGVRLRGLQKYCSTTNSDKQFLQRPSQDFSQVNLSILTKKLCRIQVLIPTHKFYKNLLKRTYKKSLFLGSKSNQIFLQDFLLLILVSQKTGNTRSFTRLSSPISWIVESVSQIDLGFSKLDKFVLDFSLLR